MSRPVFEPNRKPKNSQPGLKKGINVPKYFLTAFDKGILLN